MKLTLFIILFCFTLELATASQKAVTDQGDVVLLHQDGTWSYEDKTEPNESELTTNPVAFSKDIESDFILKSSKTDSSFAINPKDWSFKKEENGDESAEYFFQLKGGDLYGMAITEQIEIKMEDLADIAFENAKAAAPDCRVIKKEYRTVNNNRVIYMEMVGTIQSVSFKYLGYYYSNSSGSTQFIAYTGVNLVDKYATDIDRFLNGFSALQ